MCTREESSSLDSSGEPSLLSMADRVERVYEKARLIDHAVSALTNRTISLESTTRLQDREIKLHLGNSLTRLSQEVAELKLAVFGGAAARSAAPGLVARNALQARQLETLCSIASRLHRNARRVDADVTALYFQLYELCAVLPAETPVATWNLRAALTACMDRLRGRKGDLRAVALAEHLTRDSLDAIRDDWLLSLPMLPARVLAWGLQRATGDISFTALFALRVRVSAAYPFFLWLSLSALRVWRSITLERLVLVGMLLHQYALSQAATREQRRRQLASDFREAVTEIASRRVQPAHTTQERVLQRTTSWPRLRRVSKLRMMLQGRTKRKLSEDWHVSYEFSEESLSEG